MATKQLSLMSPDTRRQIIDYIVYQRLGMNCPVWWGEERTSPVAIAYRTWALGVTPVMRALLETMTSDALQDAYDECNDDPGWLNVHLWLNELQEHQEEITRRQAYHQSLSQKGVQARRSRRQPDEVLAAVQDMHVRTPKITAKLAHAQLTCGYAMPDGRVVTFKPPITLASFQRRYWKKMRH